ncbi:MAG: Mrr restriction system protein, partial [Eggerthellaceae bacterium]|nr:Mrr restriction system protein [Eggerthellaceae bacterium]
NNPADGTELGYRLAWARTYLKKYGVITNTSRGVWIISPDFDMDEGIDPDEVVKFVRETPSKKEASAADFQEENEVEKSLAAEVPWREQLSDILLTMNPYAFERLAQRLLRESGFSEVHVTKCSGDGGIDGNGKLRINGLLSFNVAFQCKRYAGSVGAPEIRDFRGSLTTDIEKGLFITTGNFTQAAIEEAGKPGKQQIDLMNGEELIDKLIELRMGIHEVTAYEVDPEYFQNI